MLRNAAGIPTAKKPHGDGIVEGMSAYPNAIRSGCNSGYQALNIALLAGATEIILVGYDMKFVKPNQGDRTLSHWHGGHPLRQQDDGGYKHTYAPLFSKFDIPKGVRILNASPDSTLKRFPYVDLDSVLRD